MALWQAVLKRGNVAVLQCVSRTEVRSGEKAAGGGAAQCIFLHCAVRLSGRKQHNILKIWSSGRKQIWKNSLVSSWDSQMH